MATDAPLLCSPCSIFGHSLWRSRARLYPTHIVLSGWSWTGRTERRIPLTAIAAVRWWGGKEDVNLELTLDDGRVVALYLTESAGTWNYTLRRLRANAEAPAPSAQGDASPVRDAPPPAAPSARTDSERAPAPRVGIAPS